MQPFPGSRLQAWSHLPLRFVAVAEGSSAHCFDNYVTPHDGSIVALQA